MQSYYQRSTEKDCPVSREEGVFMVYRRSNLSLARYRKTDAEIMETAHSPVESGVHLLDLTMGEDPAFFPITVML